jgi:hypothetical protein
MTQRQGLPFFKLIKKQDKFQWTQEAQVAFEDLKKYLNISPTLVAPKPHELAKLSSSRAMVPTWVFLQELHEPSISKALAKAPKAAKSSQETPPPN